MVEIVVAELGEGLFLAHFVDEDCQWLSSIGLVVTKGHQVGGSAANSMTTCCLSVNPRPAVVPCPRSERHDGINVSKSSPSCMWKVVS